MFKRTPGASRPYTAVWKIIGLSAPQNIKQNKRACALVSKRQGAVFLRKNSLTFVNKYAKLDLATYVDERRERI